MMTGHLLNEKGPLGAALSYFCFYFYFTKLEKFTCIAPSDFLVDSSLLSLIASI